MTKKLLKIILILMLIIGFSATYVSATDINLNLPGTDTNQINDIQTDDNIDNQNIDNPYTTNQDDIDNIDDNNDFITPTDTQTLQPSTVTSNSDSSLSITNIINILLITVGVILILLAIAIIIRLKS